MKKTFRKIIWNLLSTYLLGAVVAFVFLIVVEKMASENAIYVALSWPFYAFAMLIKLLV